jgi:hypothetical protein
MLDKDNFAVIPCINGVEYLRYATGTAQDIEIPIAGSGINF